MNRLLRRANINFDFVQMWLMLLTILESEMNFENCRFCTIR